MQKLSTTDIRLNPNGEIVGINPNGHSVTMMWRITEGRSWVNHHKTCCRAIFKYGLQWCVFTENDCRVAYKILIAAMEVSTDGELHCYARRLQALQNHANKHGIRFELPKTKASLRKAA